MITEIEIRNFRSIGRIKINCKDITIFIGENDAGKSNILRALNLFFNNETDYGHPFDFNKDWNRNSKQIKGKAKEIEIILTLALPRNYLKKGLPEFVIWKKVWRKEGLQEQKEKKAYLKGKAFLARSRISNLLDRIRFRYVPAVKDRNFFTKIQGDLYEVLAEVVDKRLRKSATSFEDSIKAELKELHDAGANIMGSTSSLKLPENLRSFFETLQFFGKDGIPLQQRGDGIQMRHIPEVLKFMGDKHNSIRSKGTANYTYIWGFEEPENSVEMNACFKMREALVKAIRKSKTTAQIFLTTHSPVFYWIGNTEDFEGDVQRYSIQKPGNNPLHSEARLIDNLLELDKDMGLMPVVAPHTEEERGKRLKAEGALQEAGHKPTLLVEGKWDEVVIAKALSLFFPEEKRQIQIIKCGNDDTVNKCGKTWPKTRPNLPAVALTDGKGNSSPYEQDSRTEDKVFFLNWEPENCTRQLKEDGVWLQTDLESCYSDTIWKHASEQDGWLEPFHCIGKVEQLHMYMEDSPLRNLTPEKKIRITKKFTEKGKKKAVEYITNMHRSEAKEALAAMRPTLQKIVNHLMPQGRLISR